MGTAPLSPLQSTNARSPRRSRIGASTSPTNTGRTRRISRAASAIPVQARPPPNTSEIGMDSPSTVKATISPRLPAAEAKRSISRLYGARVSPTRIPVRSTARKPEPCASVVTPYTRSANATVRNG